MTLLGAIFAGGQARRFGSDKAAVAIDGQPMLDRIATRLRAQCDAVVVVGRDWPGLPRIDDRPRPGLGPLGALAGALGHAAAAGYDAVLTSGCDLPDLPPALADTLTPGPAVIAGQPLLGLWPSALADRLVAFLDQNGDHAMRAWIAAIGARRVTIPDPIPNINTREELDRYLAGRITPPADPPPSR